jgi:hypothetical protein
MNLLFPEENHSSSGFLVLELVIPKGGFFVLELVIPGRITS